MGEPIDEDAPPTIDRILDLLDLEVIDRDLYRGRNPKNRWNHRVFGGQVAAQALRAATLTVETDHSPHSLHSYFLRPGKPGVPIVFLVERIRDGTSFTTRRVVARQHGEAIFSLAASFHRSEPGGEYQIPPAAVPRPDEPTGFTETILRRFNTASPFEVRELGPDGPDDSGIFTSARRVWIRTRGEMPDDPDLHACMLTYVSDMGVVFAARIALGLPFDPTAPGQMMASLDHAVWFHRPLRADDWVLYDLKPVSNGGARALVHGSMHAADGTLGLSVTQEALLREGRS